MLMGLVKGKAAMEAGSSVESGRGNIRVSNVFISIINEDWLLDEWKDVTMYSQVNRKEFRYRV